MDVNHTDKGKEISFRRKHLASAKHFDGCGCLYMIIYIQSKDLFLIARGRNISFWFTSLTKSLPKISITGIVATPMPKMLLLSSCVIRWSYIFSLQSALIYQRHSFTSMNSRHKTVYDSPAWLHDFSKQLLFPIFKGQMQKWKSCSTLQCSFNW